MNNYLLYSRVIKQVDSHKGNFKSVIFNMKKGNKIPEGKFGQIYRVTLHISKNLNVLKRAVKALEEHKHVEISNPHLFMVLLNEYFFGKYREIRGGGKLKRVIKENESFLREQLQVKEGAQNARPDLLVKGKVFLRFKNSIDEQLLSQALVKATGNQNEAELFHLDHHIPNLLQLDYSVYSKALPFLNQEAGLSEYTIQGKSSCFPVFLLLNKVNKYKLRHPDKNFRFDIIDACAAPGNKTIQLSEQIGDAGRVFAFEKDPGRAAVLKNRLKERGITNVRVFNKDFLKSDPEHKLFRRVRFIVADPSCSGTGMLSQIFLESKGDESKAETSDFESYCDNQFSSLDERAQSRIKRLSEFQKTIVTHCLKFPKLLRMTYSTCSLYKMENEEVVAQVLSAHQGQVKLLNTFTKWETRGFVTDQLAEGKKCVRANPFKDETDGFFVSLLKKRRKIGE